MNIRLPSGREERIGEWAWRLSELIDERLLAISHTAVTKGVRTPPTYKQSGKFRGHNTK